MRSFSPDMEHRSVLGCLLLVVLVGIFPGATAQTTGGQQDCLSKVLPCKDYLKSTSPPATCCVPLKAMIADDGQCLCFIVNNQDILQQFNATKEEAITMTKACGANPDISICKAAGSPTGSPTTPSAPTTNTTGGSSANNSTSKNGAADEISPSASFGLVVLSMASLLFASLNP